ncbi:Polyadenylate-binding protein 2 [Histomonas meleagridis]|uniref:Polyadenylate-binding protein 2 n=1 Tax=Histomonas meleagridis TaxID=135588 RepID=UPI00355AA5F1|nr:Polyadenylate-binding protein 2 [Histomonas meleagridis]KAH0804927.1 Polyadenylate-binding protein 2 [Histomonas meleagridis]
MAAPTNYCTIYAGDLPMNYEDHKTSVTEDFLVNLFAEAGKIIQNGVAIKHREDRNGRPYAFAFITFETREMAEKAVAEFNYTKLDGQPIRLSIADAEAYRIRKSGLGNLFIKNLDPSIEVSQLHEAFANFGDIISCKIPTDINAQGQLVSRGYGYVQFRYEKDAQQAITDLKDATINGRNVQIEPYRRRQKVNPEETFTNVYIKDLPSSIQTNEDLKKLFSEYGEVQNPWLVFNKGKPAPYGFCNMMTHEAAVEAVKGLNGKVIDGSKVYAGRAMKKGERLQHLRELSEKFRQANYEKYRGRNLYIRGFGKDVTEDKLRDYFKQFGEIESLTIMKDDNGASREFGFVTYKTVQEADNCIKESLINSTLDGKQLYVGKAQSREERVKAVQRQRSTTAYQHQHLLSAMPGNTTQYQMAPAQLSPMAPSQNMMYPMFQQMMTPQITSDPKQRLRTEVLELLGNNANSQAILQKIRELSDEQINNLLNDQKLLREWVEKK